MYRKTPVLKSLLNKVAGGPTTSLKVDLSSNIKLKIFF